MIKTFYTESKNIINPDHIQTLEQQVDKYYSIVFDFFSSEAKNIEFSDSESLSLYLKGQMGIESKLISNNLQIYKYKTQILNASIYKKTVLVQADTGCGKSTQIPLYYFTSPEFESYSVYVTEPRNFAAINLARKVENDMIGQISVSSCLSKTEFLRLPKRSLVYFNEITFLNILLDEIHKEVPLQDSKVVILDEIHEYSVEIEIVLGLLLKFIRPKRPDLSIIITSATLQYKELSLFLDCPVILCSGRSFPVQTYYLKQYTNYYHECLNMVEKLVLTSSPKTILVFFAGFHEITSAQAYFIQKFSYLTVLLLHGKQEIHEQEEVMKKRSTATVIFATNFAESSLTIPNVTHVVDCGRENMNKVENSYNHNIKIDFISKTSAIQRKGRAGREFSGVCYRMYTLEEYENMSNFRTPYILCSNLELVMLKFFKYGLQRMDFPLFHRPSQESVKSSMYSMYINEELKVQNNVFEITTLGDFVSELDFDPPLGKMIYESNFCLEVITIACVCRSCEFLFTTKE